MTFKNVKLRNKIIVLALFIILVFTALIAFYIIPTVSNIIEERTMVKLRELTDLPYSEMQRQFTLYESGEKTLEEAQTDVLDFTRNLRYSEVEYFWVNDIDGLMLMHPIADQLVGNNVLGLEDADGKLFFQEMVDKVKDKGQGIVKYQWPKPGKEEAQPKISFVRGFKEWNWVVGTGVYVDDLQEIKNDIYGNVIIISLVIIVFSFGLIMLIVIPLNKTLRDIIVHTNQYKDLDFREPIGITSKDELGKISMAFDKVSEGLRELLQSMIETSEELTRDAMTMADDVTVLEESSDKTLASTTDISAVIEQTTAATHTVANTVDEIKDAITVVAEKATEGADQASDVSKRALQLKEDAVDSKKNASEMYSDVREVSGSHRRCQGSI